MKTHLLAAAIVLLSGVQAFGQNCGCGCSNTHMVVQPTSSCGCNHCCQRCHRPLLELVEGIGCTLHSTAATVKHGVQRLFSPITFNGGCGCHKTVSCGCDTCGGGEPAWDTYEMSSPEMEIIEQPATRPAVPTMPGPPQKATSEPAEFQTPAKWQPVGNQAQRPTTPSISQYMKRVPASSSTHAATYYAPVRSR